jgi:hypothetical protein
MNNKYIHVFYQNIECEVIIKISVRRIRSGFLTTDTDIGLRRSDRQYILKEMFKTFKSSRIQLFPNGCCTECEKQSEVKALLNC